jgi:5-methyltetrahydrofolate--homocysteine methyltransferase
MTEILHDIASNLYDGSQHRVAALVREALQQGVAPERILREGLIAGMNEVGRDFKVGDLFTPEVLIAARAMHAGLDVLRPVLAECDVPSAGRCVIGTVKGDLHDIGKNLVKMMMEGAGFEVIDLGTDVQPEAFVEAVRQHRPDLLGMSALLTTTMPAICQTVAELDEAGLRDSVKVMIGGAPLTAAFAREIGADGYAPDAASAVELARALTNGRSH